MDARPAASVVEPHPATEHHDYQGAKLGMWIFIMTELILFGGLFIAYGVYREMHADDFHTASSELNVRLGVANTLILLTSSLTIALSITALRLRRKGQAMVLLASTMVLGCAFLVNKFFEWSAKIHHGLYPGSEHLMARPPGQRLFFGLYYGMTGLHGLHVTVGVVLMAVMLRLIARGKIRHDNFIALENSGLYWHLVDVIWIFLLPLFYLAA
ncbi:MAG: cytochrome c oxidase subunit 3 family protein [Polyangia bacterium]|jgi:cytochrome c oxidase subunit 3